jgi:hypothetical protein
LHSSISAEVLYRITRTKDLLADKHFISVHYRNTDYTSDIKKVFSMIDKLLNKQPNLNIFWATDDKQSLSIASSCYGSKIISGCVSVDINTFPEVGSLHSLGDKEFALMPGLSRTTMLADFFHDVYFMSLSKFHIQTSGNVAFLVNTLKSMPRSLRRRFYGFEMSDNV